MRVEEIGSISIVMVDSTDEKQAVFHALEAQHDREVLGIVLTGQITSAFQSPKDFYDLRLLKRQKSLSITFVIPRSSLAKWAMANGFAVYPSLEALIKSAAPRSALPSVATPYVVEPTKPVPDSSTSYSVLPSKFAADTYENDNFTKIMLISESSLFPAIPPLFTSEQMPSLSLEKKKVAPLTEPLAPFPQKEVRSFTEPLTPFPKEKISTFTEPLTPFPQKKVESLTEPLTPFPQKEEVAPPTEPLAPFPMKEEVESLTEPLSLPPEAKVAVPKKRSYRKRLGLILILVVVVGGAALSGGWPFSRSQSQERAAPAGITTVGHLYFLSSRQLSNTGNNGINDKIEINLSHLPASASGKSYYIWLRSDADMSDGTALLVGQLSMSSQGSASLTYVDDQHSDLLASMSRVLITEEPTNPTPVSPSPDPATWHYKGSITQIPNPDDQKHLSLLDHLRHLLTTEPALEARGLHGGLTLWLYRNTGKLQEWSRNAQDGWGNTSDTALMRRQTTCILDFLDGLSEVATDVREPAPDLVDPVQGSVGLLQLHANQDPASYLQQISTHLVSLLETPGSSDAQKQNAIQINIAINYVRNWLNAARQDAKQLIALSDNELQTLQAQMLLNDMVAQLTNAYVGVSDPATGQELHGVAWIYSHMHSLATIDVHPE